MKLFISHKNEDSDIALSIANYLRKINVDYYLDVLDDATIKDGKQLVKYLKNNMDKCSDIVVVLSKNTNNSQWVPFEVGMSTEKGLPAVIYICDNTKIPEYLEYWPRLRKPEDFAKYIAIKEDLRGRISLLERLESRKYSEHEFIEKLYDRLKNQF